jgi:hypothetical protein
MLIRFTEDYEKYTVRAEEVLGHIMTKIAKAEVFMGTSKELDKLYAQSVVIHALIDHFSYENNAGNIPDPNSGVAAQNTTSEAYNTTLSGAYIANYNEKLLQCLKSILDVNICGSNQVPARYPENLLPPPVDVHVLNAVNGGLGNPPKLGNLSDLN